MTDKSRRLRALLRVAGIKEKQAEASFARAQLEHRDAEVARDRTVGRLAEVSGPVPGTVASLDARRQQADLRIDAVVAANAVVAETTESLAMARLRWQAATRQRRSMDELDSRERAVQAVLAARANERALDDVLRSRRGHDQQQPDELEPRQP